MQLSILRCNIDIYVKIEVCKKDYQMNKECTIPILLCSCVICDVFIYIQLYTGTPANITLNTEKFSVFSHENSFMVAH
jgi:hypothetical protein